MRKGHAWLVIALMGLLAGGLYARQNRSPSAATLTAQDYIDMQQLYVRYARAISLGNPEEYVGVFTPDGEVHIHNVDSDRHYVGHKALAELVRNSRMRERGQRAWPAPPVLSPAPEGAKGTALFFLLDASGKQRVINLSGVYEDSLVKTADGWRFKTRTLRADELIMAGK